MEDRSESVLGGRPDRRPVTARRVIAWVVATVVMLALSVAAVFYGLGPLTHQRDQRATMAAYKLAINHAAAETNGLGGVTVPTQPPLTGATVGILQIPILGLQQTVTEGVGPTQTVSGPGHVPGTAGLGQPGNSAVVARRAGFGGPFADLSQLRRGDQIQVVTTEGHSVYLVRRVRTVIMTTSAPASTPGALGAASALATTTTAAASTKGAAGATKGATGGTKGARPTTTLSTTGASRPASAPAIVTVNKLYGPTPDDQLTLVTSASSAPWNTDRAVVVTARMQGLPFAPTPQQSRSPSQTGTGGDPGSLPLLILALLALGATIVGAAALYRRASLRSAYLLTTAPLIVFTILGAEAAGRLFPAWL
ncbi:MAG TPA: class E sortase [Acidimicrobiales bacterium]|nr:class E sortase [Acidimicrobiales bacterium]